MSEIKVEIGQALTKEQWLNVRDDLTEAFPMIANLLRAINFEGKGEQDAEEFLAEAQLALQAMTYVGNFASDKCRIIVLPGKNGGEQNG